MLVEKADWTWPTLPVTGRDRPVADGVPTVSPCRRRLALTCAMVAGVGPNCWANCDGVKKWWYSGDPGSDTAWASAARAAGSRGLRVTVSGRAVELAAGPSNVAPGGTWP